MIVDEIREVHKSRRLQMLFKIVVLRYSPVLESLFNKVAGLEAATLLKRDSSTGTFLGIL